MAKVSKTIFRGETPKTARLDYARSELWTSSMRTVPPKILVLWHNWEEKMGKPRFEYMAQQIIGASKLCIENQFYIPGVMVIYCGIDIMAWSYRLKKEENSRDINKYFKRWAGEFLLPGANLDCTAEDLWAARCGVVHAFTSESEEAKKLGIKQIYYDFGVGQEKFRKNSKKTGAKVLNICDLGNAFVISAKRFNAYLQAHPSEADLVYGRADKFLAIFGHFSNIPQP